MEVIITIFVNPGTQMVEIIMKNRKGQIFNTEPYGAPQQL